MNRFKLCYTFVLSSSLILSLVLNTVARISPRLHPSLNESQVLLKSSEFGFDSFRPAIVETIGPPFLQETELDGAARSFLMRMGEPGTVRRDVAEVILKTVGSKPGSRIVGVGSWITGKKFVEGTSDFDMRLSLPANTTEAEAVEIWKSVRQNLIDNVRSKFGSKANEVLAKMNLYPPEVVLEGIDDATEALSKLTNEVKVNPNLGGAKVEGLWGKGSKAFRDTYESTAGRAFWADGNKVTSGFADLLPVGETRGVYSIGGTANSASQFADKVDDALREYDAKTVKKQLNRLRSSLAKSRDLARMEKTTYLDDLLKKINSFDDTADGLAKLRQELMNPSTRQAIDNALGRARMDSALLKKFASSSNPRDLTILKEMLEEGTGRWARVKNALSEASSHVPWNGLLQAFMAFMVVIQVKAIVGSWRAGDYEKAFQEILINAGFIVSLPAGLLSLIVSSIIEDAKDAGYTLVARYQDCEDLLAGIYEVKGREKISNDLRAETNIKELALKYAEKDEVAKIVAEHSRLAASREEGGKETKKVDAEVEKKLISRCTPEILGKWTMMRAELLGDAVSILNSIDERFATIFVTANVNPDPAILKAGRAEVDAKAIFSSGGFTESKLIEEYIASLRQLGGENHLVAVSVKHGYRWWKDGTEISFVEEDFVPGRPIFNSELTSKRLTFEDTDPHTAQLEYLLSIDVMTSADDVIAAKKYLTRTISIKTPFQITVIEDTTPTPTATPTSTPTPLASPKASPEVPPGPTGNVRLTIPAEVQAIDVVDIKAFIPSELRSKAGKADWYPPSCSETPTIDSAKLSFRNPRDGKPANEYVSYALRDANDQKIGEASATILVKPVLFGGTAPGIWTASSGPAGIAVERQPAIRKFQDKDSGVVRAKVEVLWADSFAPKTFEEIQAEMTKAKGGNEGLALTPVTIAGFKGILLERKEIKQGATGSGYVDLGLPDTELGGWGYAIKNCIVIKFSYSAYGGGVIRGESWAVWWNDVPFLRSQTRAAATEAKAVLTSLALGPDGKFTKTPYKGPKLDGSDTPTVKLVLSPDIKKLRKGDVVNVQAVIENEENAEKPFKYDWSGDHAGSGANVQFLATQPGKQRLGVVVANIGGASVEFEVEDLKAVIKQVTPASPKVIVGTPATFSAQLLSGGQPASGNYVYRWQPTPDVKFEPAEGPANQAKAVFSRPGRQKVFVQVLEKKGEILQTLAESEQIEIEVIKPEFKITFSPPTAAVGKEVKAKVEVSPADLKDIDFRWEVTPNGKQTLESQDKREITLIPQDTKPVTVTANARVPFTGDDLGKQTATITASKLDVKAVVLGVEGPKPQVWKEGVGLVPLETGIAVGQFVGLRAEVTPAQDGLRYEWSLNEDSHFAGNSMSQQIRVSRSQTGTCEAAVIVRDKNGLELGRGAATFDVTVSQADIDNGKKRSSAAAKVAEAKAILPQGKLDEAIGLANEAKALDPKSTEAATLGTKWSGDRTTIQNQLSKVRNLIDQGKFSDAARELAVAKKLHPLYPPIVTVETELAGRSTRDDTAKRESIVQIKRGTDLYEKGENAAAINAYGQALQADPKSAAAYAGRCLAKRNANDATAANDCDSALRIDPNNATAYRGRSYIKRANNDIPGALADAEHVIALDPNDYGGYLARGLVKAAMGDSSGAVADYDRAIRLYPNYPMTYYNRGIAKINLKENSGALADFNHFLTMRPTYSPGYNNRGIVNERLGNTALALADYQKAVDLDPNNETAKANLARLKGMGTPPVGPPVVNGKAIFLPLDLTPIGGKKGQPHDLNGIQVDDGSYTRLKPTDEKRLTYTIQVLVNFNAASVAIVSQLDDAINLTDGMTIARMTVIKSTGEERFDIKAGIHSSEWNRGDGPKHKAAEPLQIFKLTRPGSVTAVRFDYVESNVEKWWGHAPGFVLKGVTLVGGGTGAVESKPPTADELAYSKKFTGKWNSNWGVIDFQVNGTRVNGTYTHDNGRIEATLSPDGKTMEGTWAESPSYKPPNDGGRVTFTISNDGKTITGRYWHGQDRDGGAWTGTRIMASPAGTPAATPKQTPIPSNPKPTPTPASKVVELLTSMNSGGVSNSPTAPAQFDTNRPYTIASIMTYHWNNGRGTSRPGTISIRASNGKVYGPYAATGLPAGSVPNAFWEIKPNVVLPPGNYVIVDSEPATWAHNSQSGGRGFTTIRGYLVTDGAVGAAPPAAAQNAPASPSVATKAGYVMAVFENRSSEAVHILGEEGMFGPENKLAPGERREVQLKMTSSGKMQFIAGRNGQIIAQKYWNGDPKNLRAYPRVVFDGRTLLITTSSR